MKINIIKVTAILLVIVVIVNLIAYITNYVNGLFFWLSTAVLALIAYKVVPRFNQNYNK